LQEKGNKNRVKGLQFCKQGGRGYALLAQRGFWVDEINLVIGKKRGKIIAVV
jgi:hypothetical protein